MGTELSAIEVSAALAGARRRARLLDEAQGASHWTEWLSVSLGVAVAAYLIITDEVHSTSGAGFALLLSAVAGTQIRRLQKRVDALTRLLRDIGYPDEA